MANFESQINAAEHPIKSVIVFKSSRAEVVRTFTVNLKAGQNKIEICALPSAIDTDTIRVSGLGEARLLDVVCTLGSNESAYDQESSSEIIRALRAKKSLLQAEKHVLEHQANLLVGYGQTLTGEHITHSSMEAFLDSFVARGCENAAAVSALDEKLVEIDRLIEKEVAKKALKKGETKRQVTVVIAVQESGPVELKLTYIVSNASWKPAYELHATTENGKPASSVTLHYRARVSQSTGEDWKNTALTLSTVASEVIAQNIPTLWPRKIQQPFGWTKGFNNSTGYTAPGSTQSTSIFGRPSVPISGPFSQHSAPAFGRPSAPISGSFSQHSAPAFGQTSTVGFTQQTGGLFGSALPAAAPSSNFGGSLFGFGGGAPVPPSEPTAVPHHDAAAARPPEGEESFEEVAVPGPFSEPTTIVSESPLSVSYSVEGTSTIPSDGEAHQVSVAVLSFEANVMHVTSPRSELEPRVYLQCKVKNTSEYCLLPGLVTVILDDSYVSKTSIKDINKGDTFDCTLGVDSATKVSYSRKGRTVKANTGAFVEESNVTTYTSKITIHNKHAFAIDLAVHDVIPMCDDKRVKVILRKPKGLADAKDGEVVDLDNNGLKVGWEKVIDGKGGEKDGKYQWLWKVGAGLQVELKAEWEVKAPADTVWVEAVMCPHNKLFG